VGFIQEVPLRRVPSLRAKFGAEVEASLQVKLVKDILSWSRAELVQRFGKEKGEFLSNLPHAVDAASVVDKGPPKSIAAERSFPPAKTEAAVRAALHPLVLSLLRRAAADYQEHCRLPDKLLLSWRQGYDSGVVSRSAPVPGSLRQWVASPQACSLEAAAAHSEQVAGDVTSAAMNLLTASIAGDWEVTRLMVAVAFAHGESLPVSNGASLGDIWQRNSSDPIVTNDAPATRLSKASYRNAEAVALQRLFSQETGEIPKDPVVGEGEDEASLRLALELQRQEAAAVAAAENSRGVGSKRKAKGPLDAFIRRNKV